MAKEPVEKLREKSRNDLVKEVLKEKQNLQLMRFDLARGKVNNSAAIRNSKKRIARLLSLENEKAKIEKRQGKGSKGGFMKPFMDKAKTNQEKGEEENKGKVFSNDA